MSKAYQKKLLLYCYLTVLAGGKMMCNRNQTGRTDAGEQHPSDNSIRPTASAPSSTSANTHTSHTSQPSTSSASPGVPPTPPPPPEESDLMKKAKGDFEAFEKLCQDFYDTQAITMHNHANPAKLFGTLSKEEKEKALAEMRVKEPDYNNEQLIQALEGALNAVYSKTNAVYYSSIANNYSPNSLGQKKPSEEEKKTIETEFKKVEERYQFLRKRWGLISDLKNKKITAEAARNENQKLTTEKNKFEAEIKKKNDAEKELQAVKDALKALVDYVPANYNQQNLNAQQCTDAINAINALVPAAGGGGVAGAVDNAPDYARLSQLFDGTAAGTAAAAGHAWLNAVNGVLTVANKVSPRAAAMAVADTDLDRAIELAIAAAQHVDIAEVKAVVKGSLNYLKTELEKKKGEVELADIQQVTPQVEKYVIITKISRANTLRLVFDAIEELKGKILPGDNLDQDITPALLAAIEKAAKNIAGANWDNIIEKTYMRTDNENDQYTLLTRDAGNANALINDHANKDEAIALMAIMHAIRLAQNVNRGVLDAACSAIYFTADADIANAVNQKDLHGLQTANDNADNNALGAHMPEVIKNAPSGKKLFCFAALRVAAQHAGNNNNPIDGADNDGQRATNLRNKAHDNAALTAIVNAAV